MRLTHIYNTLSDQLASSVGKQTSFALSNQNVWSVMKETLNIRYYLLKMQIYAYKNT